jgi:hypothetical protein
VAAAVIAIPIAGLLAVAAAVAVITLPAGQQTSGGTGASGTALVGEHSALGGRQVDALNAAIASMGRATGEHAGLSRADYRAGEAPGR